MIFQTEDVCTGIICIELFVCMLIIVSNHNWWGTSWSYGSWIYNNLCKQWPSPLQLWVRTSVMARCTRYNIMW